MRFVTLLLLSFITVNAYSNIEPEPDVYEIFEDFGLPGDGEIEEDLSWMEEIPLDEDHISSPSVLDVDGDGIADALTDGLIVMRYLFGMRGESLTENVISYGATRSYIEIEEYLDTLMPH